MCDVSGTSVEGKTSVRSCIAWIVVATAGLIFAGAISLTLPLHSGSLAAVCVAGGALVLVSLISPGPTDEKSRTMRLVQTVPWIAIFLIWCAWEVTMFFAGNNHQWPTLSILTDPIFDDPVGRFIGGLAWYCGSVWLVRRCWR